MSQQQRSAWTGGSDEALVPLGRGDDSAPTTKGGRDRPADQAQPAARTSPASGRSTATVADFTAERYLRGQAAPPWDGWRRFVYWLTAGHINFGPGCWAIESSARPCRIGL